MEKILLFGTAILVATSVLAFGGGGKSRKSSIYRGTGVDAISLHIGGEGSKVVCTDDEDVWNDTCIAKCEAGLEHNSDGSCTVCANGNVYLSYEQDPCGTETHLDGNCISNRDCNDWCVENGYEKCFCHLDARIIDGPPPVILPDRPDKGVCMSADEYEDEITNTLGLVRRNTQEITWWAADNWCKAHGMNLLDISKFECYESNSDSLVVNGYYSGGCCASGQTCEWDRNWYTNANKVRYSTVLDELMQAFGYINGFWFINAGANMDAPTIGFYGGNISPTNHCYGSFALCQ